MRLIFERVENGIAVDFIKAVQKYLQLIYSKYLSYNLLTAMDTHLNDLYQTRRKISTRFVIDYAFKHLIIRTTKDNYFLEFNSNIKIPNFNIRLMDILKVIEFGDLEFKGTGIITNCFEEVRNNISAVYQLYMDKKL